MAHKKSCSHKHKKRHSYRGGNAPNPSSYSSGAGYGMAVNGTMESQASRVNNSGNQSNGAIGVQGQKVGGGGRRKRHGSVKKGGFWGVLNQAIVPFSILGLQQSYGRRNKQSGGTKKHRRKR
jgi:hypothetical protein